MLSVLMFVTGFTGVLATTIIMNQVGAQAVVVEWLVRVWNKIKQWYLQLHDHVAYLFTRKSVVNKQLDDELVSIALNLYEDMLETRDRLHTA